MNDRLASLYKDEERMGIITTVFSILAVIISCSGLFGMMDFVAEKKTKEIGIRKVMGASVFQIICLLSKQFTKWVIEACVIACPVAYYFVEKWLLDFAYRIEIGFGVFILSGVSALVVAILTIGLQTIRASLANPINSLKYE